MTLIETYPDESEADFRAAVDEVLSNVPIPPRPNWWHPYEVRGLFDWHGIRFRHFFCVANSVEMWLWKSAEAGGQRRVIRLPSESLIMFLDPTMIGQGIEVPVLASDVTVVRAAV
jgi:hypothetical protein